jgi:molecular chaperone IbpA
MGERDDRQGGAKMRPIFLPRRVLKAKKEIPRLPAAGRQFPNVSGLFEGRAPSSSTSLRKEDWIMRSAFDFTPYRRSTVGFDRLFDFLEQTAQAENGDNYPPFDLEKVSDDRYRITLAVAGFRRDEIDITANQNLLTIAGRKAEARNRDGNYLHLGIATRAFERRFELADFVRVDEAALNDGLLSIELVREVPEAMKPRKIAIGSGAAAAPAIDGATGNADSRQAQPAKDMQAA